MYKPTFFRLEELVPKTVFLGMAPSKRDQLWWLFDERQLRTIDALRRRFGPMIANTWHQGGKFNFRGWRPGDCADGSRYSQHKFGRAVDLDPEKVSADEIREDILINPSREEYRFITCIEAGVPWLHTDCRNWDRDTNGILVVHP